MSAGQDYKKDAEGKPIAVQVVNLLVTPDQAEQLSLAASQTAIQLVLRNPLDREVTKTSGAAMANLFTGGKYKAEMRLQRLHLVRELSHKRSPGPSSWPLPPKKEDFTMEIISGTKKNELKFGGGEVK